MNNLFDLTKEDIHKIGIFKTNANDNCYIADSDNKANIYDGFILRNGPRAQTICKITFHPSSVSGKFIPRPEFKVAHTSSGETKKTEKDVRISFAQSEEGYQEFWKMISFLSLFKEMVDIGDFKYKYKVIDSDTYMAQFKSKGEAEQAIELIKIISETKNNKIIEDALNVRRTHALKEFADLLEKEENVNEYKAKYFLSKQGEEIAWHHLFKNNQWILGLIADVRFIRDFFPEADIGISNTISKGSPNTDILGIHDYTVLVELKTPRTDIFSEKKKNTARTNTWSFSDKFIDGISQCLGQKFTWEKIHKQKDLINSENNEVVNQDVVRTIDPKTFFIIGSKKREFPEDSLDCDIHTKRDTFELFRRNNRNIEIITYDELYEKAYFIVYNKKL